MDTNNLFSFGGVFILPGVGWLFSANRRRMNFCGIGWVVVMQLLLGMMIIQTANP